MLYPEGRLCVICAYQGHDVVRALALLAATEKRPETYQVMTRCGDQLACRDRCEAAGDRWPLASTPASPRA
jgi:hypothetical protein